MWKEPRTSDASRLRQRKFEIIRHLPPLADQLPGTLTLGYTRCGKPNCRCARGKGRGGPAPCRSGAGISGCRPGSVGGQRQAVGTGTAARKEAEEKEAMNGPTPRRLRYFVTRELAQRVSVGDAFPQFAIMPVLDAH